MTTTGKGYKGFGMEGAVASWYAKNTAKDTRRFVTAAETLVANCPKGAPVLEIAPGPGYLAIELARRGFRVTGLDISRSFVEIATANARAAGVQAEFRLGNASEAPFADASFEAVVTMAAFKNFSDPVGALNEMHRVLRPGGQAWIYDLRREAGVDEVDGEVRGIRLGAWNAAITRLTFRWILLPRAYSRMDMERMARESQFGGCEIRPAGIGFEARLRKRA
jgi:ubiquinone/menaquinone biosynthesis C-methylase UbiE